MTAPLLLSVFPTFAVGGAQSRFAMLANHLGSTWRHAIVAMDGITAARERLDADIQVSFPVIDVRKGDLIGNLRRFRNAIRAIAPTTMLTHNFGSMEWALANRIEIVHHVHVEDGFGPEERDKQLARRVWVRRAALRGRAVVLPSRTLLNIAQHVWGLNHQRLHYIPNGIDLARFTNEGTAAAWPVWKETSGPIIGTVAALRPEKNVGRLIRAFHHVASHTPARLLIVGDGPQRSELMRLAEDLGETNRVVFAGHVARPDDLIKSFDIFAMPSDTEQMPISLLEAMAAGRPTVATDVGDVARMLPAIGRAFVTPCNDEAFGKALLTLAQCPSARADLGRASQKIAIENFGQDDMFRRWSSLLEVSGP